MKRVSDNQSRHEEEVDCAWRESCTPILTFNEPWESNQHTIWISTIAGIELMEDWRNELKIHKREDHEKEFSSFSHLAGHNQTNDKQNYRAK